MNAKEWLKEKGILSTNEYDLLNLINIKRIFHISEIFDFIWPTDDEQYQEYSDEWIDFVINTDIQIIDENELFPKLQMNSLVKNFNKFGFMGYNYIQLFVKSNNSGVLVEFMLLDTEYFKLNRIIYG